MVSFILTYDFHLCLYTILSSHSYILTLLSTVTLCVRNRIRNTFEKGLIYDFDFMIFERWFDSWIILPTHYIRPPEKNDIVVIGAWSIFFFEHLIRKFATSFTEKFKVENR